jgi:hypothetical protein
LVKIQTGSGITNVEAVMSQLMAMNRQSFSGAGVCSRDSIPVSSKEL